MAGIKSFSDLKEVRRLDIHSMNRKELHHSFSVLNEQMNIIYQFVLSYNDYINTGHNYSSDTSVTMLEIHTLTDICDHPDSTVSSLAYTWNRSLSATSQTVKRLMDKGLVTRENDPTNRKIFYLRPTKKGMQLSDTHKQYDVEDTVKTIKSLLHRLSFDEIETMFRGLATYTDLLRSSLD